MDIITSCLSLFALLVIVPGYQCHIKPATASYILDPVKEHTNHYIADHPPAAAPGIWRKKTIWKPRYIKHWRSSKVWKPVWRKLWGPVEVHEWVPIPKPPPGHPPSTDLDHVEEHSTSPIWKLEHPDTVTWPYLKPVEIETTDENEVEYDKPEEVDFENVTDSYKPGNGSWKAVSHEETGGYYVNSPNPESPSGHVDDEMSRLLEPPVASPVYRHVYFTTDTPESEQTTTENYHRQVSPYAVKLAQAIILDRLKKNESGTTQRSLGLTQVKFLTDSSTVSPTPRYNNLAQVSVSSTTTDRTLEKEKVFIVTPISTKPL